jgi:hypothetical protein
MTGLPPRARRLTIADGGRLGAGPSHPATHPVLPGGTQTGAFCALANPAARGLCSNGREAETEGKFYAQ